ncbi:MAG: hypothetical protein M9922_15470 [Microthrixaceae bacterium]|nr:hypothetical protein [Microthrixaceae bacterium]
MSAVTHPTKFDSVLDLARLPWFTVEAGIGWCWPRVPPKRSARSSIRTPTWRWGS